MRATAQVTRASRRAQVIRDQEQWMQSCGGNLAGYVAKYGTPEYPDYERWAHGYYGAGGEAIYAADLAYLNKLKEGK